MSVQRNAPCPCGSGKRFKDCCGKLAVADSSSKPRLDTNVTGSDVNSTLFAALAEQRAGRLAEATRLYESALVQSPDHPDALHMMGVALMEQGRADEAVRLILRALDVTDWQFETFQHNLGLALGRCADVSIASIGFSEIARAYRTKQRESYVRPDQHRALVSVLIPLFNHTNYIERALTSVFEQTHQNIEVLLIDDGSTDQSFARASEIAKHSPFPIQLFARENKGAATTLNELASLANGHWLHPLNSDDFLSANRIEQMLVRASETGARWLFGGVSAVDSSGASIDALSDARVFQLYCSQSELDYADTISAAFLLSNPAISTGNLFIERTFFETLNGFREHRYHHDWDFCLRAACMGEPAFCEARSYFYRFHGSNTISEASSSRSAEADAMMREHLETLAKGAAANPWFPNATTWGVGLYSKLLSAGLGRVLPRPLLRKFAEQAIQRFQSRS